LADVAQLAERVLGKDEVTSSILVIGSSLRSALARRASAGKPEEAKAGAPSFGGQAGGSEGWRAELRRASRGKRRLARRASAGKPGEAKAVPPKLWSSDGGPDSEQFFESVFP
jgi:hypothetical protein